MYKYFNKIIQFSRILYKRLMDYPCTRKIFGLDHVRALVLYLVSEFLDFFNFDVEDNLS